MTFFTGSNSSISLSFALQNHSPQPFLLLLRLDQLLSKPLYLFFKLFSLSLARFFSFPSLICFCFLQDALCLWYTKALA